MKIAVASDETYPVHAIIFEKLKQHGHEPIPFGALRTQQAESWVEIACEVSRAIQQGTCNEGILFCWTGTGVCMAANKHSGIRAALCTDAQTAHGARIWNHANILVLSNRLLSQDIAIEILTAWFDNYDKSKGAEQVDKLQTLDN